MFGFLLVTIFLFILGTAIGSFLNVVIYRSFHAESWVEGRSRCDYCKKQIHWYDNIPLLSYFILGGQCRYCKKSISLIHPVVEFLTASLFVWWYWSGFFFFRLTTAPFTYIQPLFWLLVAVLLLIIFVSDILYLIIPDFAVLILFLISYFYRVILTWTGIMQFNDFALTIFSAILLVSFFYFLWFVTKGKGFGFGDVKLAAPLALILGWPKVLIGVFLAFIIGSIIGIILITCRKKKFGQVVPFGPFLISGTVMALLWGEQMWNFYFSLF